MERHNTICNCINLRRASNAITQYYDGFLKPLNITVSQYSLLNNINRLEQASIQKLSDAVGLERTTLIRNLKPLFDKEFIEYDDKQGRTNIIKLTLIGHNMIEKIKPLWQEAQNNVDEIIGEENILEIRGMLRRLENIGKE